MKPSDIIVVGYHGGHNNVDDIVIESVAIELIARDLGHLATNLISSAYDSFDMTMRPKHGDAMDAIIPGVKAVVALNILLTPRIPGGRMPTSESYLYCRDNWTILNRCMRVGALLFCFGSEQPWHSEFPFVRKELTFEGSNLYLYVRK